MTATYDGKLKTRQAGKTTYSLEPCCEVMHAMIVRGIFAANSKGDAVMRFGEKKTAIIRSCPFCGAEVSQ